MNNVLVAESVLYVSGEEPELIINLVRVPMGLIVVIHSEAETTNLREDSYLQVTGQSKSWN